jgi:tRNA (guanine37-N1)-methyltransferase
LSRKEKDAGRLEESVSLKIPKKKGENAIQLLSKLKLLNRKLAPQSEDGVIHVPLSRAPQPEERRQIDRALGKPRLSQEKFPSRSQAFGSLEEVLAQQLPSNIIPLVSKSFDVIGDIAIIELSPTTEPFEKSIAESLMKVQKNVKIVFSKAGPITDSLRLRPLHHILGDNRTETIHKELGCRFKIDISKAFFSPRLSAEHLRVAEQVRPGECVVDMFAGVGPFAIMIAKRLNDVQVHAIDANPEATKLIEENARMNKVQAKIKVWSGDARVVVENNLLRIATRIIMNHPSQAREFLEPACQALRQEGGIVHYYTFADGLDSESKARRELAAGLDNSGWKIEKTIETRKVRGVAPMKWQVAVEARLAPARFQPRVQPTLSG